MAKPKTRSLRQVRGTNAVCELRRDHYEFGDWSIMTDGYRVWISKQKVGESPTDRIEVPKPIFDKMFDSYGKKTPVGKWRNDKFYVAR
jgi:hypothetical protein